MVFTLNPMEMIRLWRDRKAEATARLAQANREQESSNLDLRMGRRVVGGSNDSTADYAAAVEKITTTTRNASAVPGTGAGPLHRSTGK